MGTLTIDLLIGPVTFPTLFQVLRIPSSFNLLLGRPWIHRAQAIPSSLHQKVKFIHDGQIITIQSSHDVSISSKPVLEITHSEDDLLLMGFTFDDIQTVEIEDLCRDLVAMSFDQHSSTRVLDMMRGMSFMPGMGLGRRQHGLTRFIYIMDHDPPFGLGYVPTKADYRYMARLRRERVRARLAHTSFDYPVRPYGMRLMDYFVRGSDIQCFTDGPDMEGSTDRAGELQCRLHQLHLGDEISDAPTSAAISPPSPDRASFFSLCFQEESTDHGVIIDLIEVIDGVLPRDEYQDEMEMRDMSQIARVVQPEPTSPFDLFGVFVIEIIGDTQTVLTPELSEEDMLDDSFEGIVSPIEECPILWTHLFHLTFYRDLSPAQTMCTIIHLWI